MAIGGGGFFFGSTFTLLTPYGITIDHDTLDDNTITLRDRDTMEQERIDINNVVSVIKDKIIV